MHFALLFLHRVALSVSYYAYVNFADDGIWDENVGTIPSSPCLHYTLR